MIGGSGPPVEVAAGSVPGPATAIRLAVREVREAAEWSLRAAGVEAGNARTAAEATALAEVCFGVGLDALRRSLLLLDRIEAVPPAPTVKVDGGVAVVTETEDMGVLVRSHRPALAVATEAGPEVLRMEGISWHPGAVGVLLAVNGSAGLTAVGVGGDGRCVGWSMVRPDGVCLVEGCDPPPPLRPDGFELDRSGPDPVGQGRVDMAHHTTGRPAVVVARCSGPIEDRHRSIMVSRSEIERRRRAAVVGGLRVDRRLWHDVAARSHRFLVPD
jgi:hypothetical protein